MTSRSIELVNVINYQSNTKCSVQPPAFGRYYVELQNRRVGTFVMAIQCLRVFVLLVSPL